MKQVKVSASYWEKLNEKERRVFGGLAASDVTDIPEAKRLLTLAKKFFPTYEEIVPFGVIPVVPEYLTYAIVYAVNGMDGRLGSITKSKGGKGITERVKKFENGKYTQIWHN